MSAGRRLTRRACLALAMAAPFGARGAQPPRVVALDWGWLSTAMGMGVAPVGAAEQRLYHDWVGIPAVPDGVTEVGLRIDPSLDSIAALRPDLILTSPLNATLSSRLQNIAPVLVNPTFAENLAPLANAKVAARLLGERLSRPSEASALIADAEQRIARARVWLQALGGRALLPVSVIDRRHLTIYGDGSLFVDVLRELGLRGLWPGPTSLWGHKALAVPDLAGLPPGDLLVIDPLPAAGAAALDPASLLARLCIADKRAIHRLPAVWGFGDVTAAARFADLLAATMGREPPS